MAQVNACLKRTFTFFNVLFAIVGGLIIGLALLVQTLSRNNGGQELEGRTTGIIMLYIMGAITMAISILGAYGAQKENRGALIAFLVCMVIGTLWMLRTGVTIAISRPQVEEVLEDRFRRLLPLDQSTENIQNMMNSVQTAFQCCGLFSYQDWQSNIPSSCDCHPELGEACQNIPLKKMFSYNERVIFRETCFPLLLHYIGVGYNILLAVVLSLGTLAVLGIVLSSVLIHQMRQQVVRPTMVLTVPTVFSPQPPKYQELYNSPEY